MLSLGGTMGDIVVNMIVNKFTSYIFDRLFDEGYGNILVWDEDGTDFIYELEVEINEVILNPNSQNIKELQENIFTDLGQIFYGG
ncbi:MAG: hypothetical protein ACK5HR_01055 [Mycoplasmatales bacterium]